MGEERVNTVPGEKQLPYYRFRGDKNASHPRVLFVGNSITLHGVKEDIGWYHEWGMAASSEARDYVHLVTARIRTLAPMASTAILPVSDWERSWQSDPASFPSFREAREWQADILVFRLSENTNHEGLDGEAYVEAMKNLVRYLNAHGTGKVLITDGFWPKPAKDEAMYKAAMELEVPFVSLRDLGTRDEMMALGKFQHAGVAIHPGDRGMEEIAGRIWSVLRLFL